MNIQLKELYRRWSRQPTFWLSPVLKSYWQWNATQIYVKQELQIKMEEFSLVLPSLRSNNKNCWLFFITALVCNVHTCFPSGIGRRSGCTSPRSRLCPSGSNRWPCVSPVVGTMYRIQGGHPRSGPGPRPQLSNRKLLAPLKKCNFFQRKKNIYVKIIICLGNCTTSTDRWHDCVIFLTDLQV